MLCMHRLLLVALKCQEMAENCKFCSVFCLFVNCKCSNYCDLVIILLNFLVNLCLQHAVQVGARPVQHGLKAQLWRHKQCLQDYLHLLYKILMAVNSTCKPFCLLVWLFLLWLTRIAFSFHWESWDVILWVGQKHSKLLLWQCSCMYVNVYHDY